ncbi:helix-turn-helix transcriptional regulator [endosymbiont 'TC1' of Trimyema compressum]|uniref:helix-turn-helix transcriptional regulator n=1 Tax=endosymbiont 'TC1' of Trimyema compressum TaxID=243899 RepID=UPI001FDF6A49|nr:HTH domain-containing protein [endosymbiont 'TC1' of Trimyema compressum]
MKIDRLIVIIMVLLEKDRISVTKLAEMFEVSPRTIYGDADTLDLAGIPIITYPGVNGGIGILENYKVSKQFFTAIDITALLSDLSNISATLSAEDMAGTLAKVKSLIPEGKREDIEQKAKKVYIDLTMWSGNTYASPNLEKVKESLEGNKLLTFTYSNSGNKNQVAQLNLIVSS